MFEDTIHAQSDPILIAYATQYGSTREVAEAIGTKLREHDLPADVRPAKEIRSLDGYHAIVLGAPFYLGSWHKDAQRFLAEHRQVLEQRPVAIFALGPIGADEAEDAGARIQLDEVLARHSWLNPVAATMFGGKYDPSRLTLTHRLLTALPASPLHNLPAVDLRDWTEIECWAAGVAEAFAPVRHR